MPNALTDRRQPGNKILMLGNTGAGKTTQLLTLKGKKFAYLFDPNAIMSIQGHDVDYEEFLPDNIDLGLTSLAKGKGDVKPSSSGTELYRRWEKDFEEKIKSGFFDAYDVICFDSLTTFADLIMDGVLGINQRSGQWPQQDDYGPQMLTLTKIMRTATALNKTLYVTGHVELKQDAISKKIFQTPLMTGRLKIKLPLLFSEVFFAEPQMDVKSGNIKYTLQTKPDRQNPTIRSTISNILPFEDVTLDMSQPLVGQGLGGIIQKGIQHDQKKVTSIGSAAGSVKA